MNSSVKHSHLDDLPSSIGRNLASSSPHNRHVDYLIDA